MNEVRQTIVINRQSHEVFAFTINPKNTPKWVDFVAREQTNETPTKLGTTYRSQDTEGDWTEFEITAFEENKMFELTKKDDGHHVKYTFKPSDDDSCELEYLVWVEDGVVSDRFSVDNIQAILKKLKTVIESKEFV